MKKLFFMLLIPMALITAACGDSTYIEKEVTEHETCLYERTYGFWGNEKSGKLITCIDKGRSNE